MKSLIKVFYAPEDTFKEVKEAKKGLWIPFLILLVLSIIIALLYVNYIVYPRRMEFLQSGQMPQEAMERAQKFMSRPFLNITTFLQTLIGVPVVLLITALVYHLATGFLGGEPKFEFTFLYVVYAKFINLISVYIKFPVSLLTKKARIHTDLALLFPFLKGKNFLYILLTQIDIFTLYSLYVTACGMAILSKVKKKNALIFVYVLWFLISILISIIGFKAGGKFTG